MTSENVQIQILMRGISHLSNDQQDEISNEIVRVYGENIAANARVEGWEMAIRFVDTIFEPLFRALNKLDYALGYIRGMIIQAETAPKLKKELTNILINIEAALGETDRQYKIYKAAIALGDDPMTSSTDEWLDNQKKIHDLRNAAIAFQSGNLSLLELKKEAAKKEGSPELGHLIETLARERRGNNPAVSYIFREGWKLVKQKDMSLTDGREPTARTCILIGKTLFFRLDRSSDNLSDLSEGAQKAYAKLKDCKTDRGWDKTKLRDCIRNAMTREIRLSGNHLLTIALLKESGQF